MPMSDEERLRRHRLACASYRRRNKEKCAAYSKARYEAAKPPPTPLPNTKVCRRCGIDKPRQCFRPRKRFKGIVTTRGGLGVDSACRQCRAFQHNPSFAAKQVERRALQAADLKQCSRCKATKPVTDFHIQYKATGRRISACRECINAKTKKWREDNPDAFEQWYARNHEQQLQRASDWRKANPDLHHAGYKRWAAANKGAVNALVAKRIAAKKRAMPPWADVKAIRAVYTEAARRKHATGERWEVDHIVPLQSAIVCGLHVAWNLRIVSKLENLRKGNKVMHVASPDPTEAPAAWP